MQDAVGEAVALGFGVDEVVELELDVNIGNCGFTPAIPFLSKIQGESVSVESPPHVEGPVFVVAVEEDVTDGKIDDSVKLVPVGVAWGPVVSGPSGPHGGGSLGGPTGVGRGGPTGPKSTLILVILRN